jgi:hypothetical protein
MEAFVKYGKNGSLPDPDELAQKDPELVEQLLLKLIDAEANGTLPDFGRDLFPVAGRRSRQSRRKRK